MNALDAIPVSVPSQLSLRDLLLESFPPGSDLRKGLRMGTFYCHYGELLRRRKGEIGVSNIGISDEEFELKMNLLLKNIPENILEFLNGE
jgi:hypothetical protein